MKARILAEENRKWWTLAAVAFALFMIMLDNTVVNVALPSIRRDLDTSLSSLEWIVSGYALSFAVLMLTGGKLVGMLTDRDLHLVETLKDVDPQKVTVEEAMSTVVYAITPETPLDVVVSTMAEHKYGSAVVMHNEKVVGIFTTVDVCRTLAELLHTRLAK